MTIKAGGRVALIAATGLLVCVAGMSWTVAASSAAETKSENVGTTKKVKQVRYYKRYAHGKHARTAQKSSEEKKPAETAEVAEAGLPGELPASVAEANARMGEVSDDTARAMTARANALLASDQPAEGQGAVTMQVVQADQLNEVDKALQEPAPPSQTTVAVAPAKPAVQAKPAVVEETSTWDQTSLIGKIFIAFGALLTIASAARMFMA
ncbi:hypothetical protein [Bradyrhizobium sp.]|uniref:hypothetical protein n=1 Tax=Bradyrhizobium sp. TaxID=376 RepID=UPI004037F57F